MGKTIIRKEHHPTSISKTENEASIYNLQFILLCLSTFLFFSSFNMIIPELPAYLTQLGGAEYKGLIIALFTVTAGISRPFSGKLADKIGRIPVMFLGGAVCILCGFLYPLTSSVFGFLLLRLFHGFSTGFQPTGQSAYVADIVPAHRRGEALGIIGFFTSIGMASGPAIGGEIALRFSIETMFYCSSIAAFLSVLVLIRMKESLHAKEKFRFQLLKIKKEEFIEPRVLVPSITLGLCVFALGVVLTIIPDFSEHLGIRNKGLFFTYFTASSLIVRILAVKFSDIYGRLKVVKVSILLLICSIISIGLAQNEWQLLAAACLFGFGVGMNHPTLVAWTIDLSEEKHRGRALATMYIALEMGIGVGAVFSGWFYGNDASMFPYTFFISAFIVSLALIFVVFFRRRLSPL